MISSGRFTLPLSTIIAMTFDGKTGWGATKTGRIVSTKSSTLALITPHSPCQIIGGKRDYAVPGDPRLRFSSISAPFDLHGLFGVKRFFPALVGTPLLGEGDPLQLPLADQRPLELGEKLAWPGVAVPVALEER